MKPIGLRGRIATALTGLSVAAAALLGLGFWGAEEYLERDSQKRLISREAEAGAPAGAQALITYNEDLARRRGYWLFALLVGGTAGVGIAAWWLSGRIAQAGLQPFGALVDQIRRLDPEARGGGRLLHSDDPELQVIVAALNAHMAQLDALLQRERTFSAAASHELRTPLNVIGGASAVLAAAPQVPANVLARIDRAVAQARRDLEALLALSRPRETGELPVVRVDQLLPEIATLYMEADPGAGTTLSWDIAGPVEQRLPAGALSIVFGNALRNALRAARGGEVRVQLTPQSIVVTDSGPGFPPEVVSAPLHPLGARSDGGSGLGLYIAQTLAQRYGWTLALGRGEGGGARVELQFGAQVT